MSETLDTRGAAEILHVSEKLTAKMAREGELPAVWLAGQWLFVRQELLTWLSDRAKEEQRFRREQVLAMAEIEKPSRPRGRPKNPLNIV